MKCRNCNSQSLMPFADLGTAPPSNAYLEKEDLGKIEKWFPLRVFTCQECWLVQTEDFAAFDELFSEDYAYFSSFSQSWLDHAKRYTMSMISRFELDKNSHVVEIAANDGYMLQYFKDQSIPCLGIEPTRSTADAARNKGIEIVEDFFGRQLALDLNAKGKSADLMAANNVLAHVPDIVDFVGGFEILLKPDGVATFEFPHLLNLVQLNQFDTIYHEHFSYLSLFAVEAICERVGLSVFDVEKLPTHGGSLRVFVQRSESGIHKETQSCRDVRASEISKGINTIEFYQDFQSICERVKNDFLKFLLEIKEDGKSVCGYGAAAKGNTLMNFAGIRPDLIEYVVDKNPSKQGKFMPGSRIPIVGIDALENNKPDYIVILPWNLKDEVTEQLQTHRQRGARLVTFIPKLEIIE